METIISGLPTSSLDVDLVMALYDLLRNIQSPWFTAQQLEFPYIMFPLHTLVSPRTRAPLHTYRSRTFTFWIVDIRTTEDLLVLTPLYLVHPRIYDLLVEQRTSGDHRG